MVLVGQDSDLGKLGLKILAEHFCGPNCDLSDLAVDVTSSGRTFMVNFYDMTRAIGERDRHYYELNETYNKNAK